MKELEILRNSEPWQWPDDAAATLLAVLRDRQAGDDALFLAAELAGNLPDPDEGVALALLELAGDARCSERSRSSAASSLWAVLDNAEMEGFDELSEAAVSEQVFRRLCDGLHALYRDAAAPKTVRRRALEASCATPREWQPAAIRAAYVSGDTEWRLTAVFCMRFIKGFQEEILAALSDEDEDTRCEALLAAGNWEIKEAWPRVAALIARADTPRSVLLAAIEAAPTIDPSEAMDLLESLENHADDEIAEAAADAISSAATFLEYGSFAEDDSDDED